MMKMKLAPVREHPFSTYDLQWVSVERDENGEPLRLRRPAPHTEYYKRSGGFKAAGRPYPGLLALQTLPTVPGKVWLDLYGRRVLVMKERYPCFDGYDCLHEDRYYHYCYLVSGDALTLVRYGDDADEILVTEDVDSTRRSWWPELKRLWGE